MESGRQPNTEGLLRGQKSSFVKTKVALITLSMFCGNYAAKKNWVKMTGKLT
jgi:hypothetical protein